MFLSQTENSFFPQKFILSYKSKKGNFENLSYEINSESKRSYKVFYNTCSFKLGFTVDIRESVVCAFQFLSTECTNIILKIPKYEKKSCKVTGQSEGMVWSAETRKNASSNHVYIGEVKLKIDENSELYKHYTEYQNVLIKKRQNINELASTKRKLEELERECEEQNEKRLKLQKESEDISVTLSLYKRCR